MLAQIGDVLPRFRIYETLFSNHERLLAALSDAFLDVLSFCITTKEFFTRAKKSKSGFPNTKYYAIFNSPSQSPCRLYSRVRGSHIGKTSMAI